MSDKMYIKSKKDLFPLINTIDLKEGYLEEVEGYNLFKFTGKFRGQEYVQYVKADVAAKLRKFKSTAKTPEEKAAEIEAAKQKAIDDQVLADLIEEAFALEVGTKKELSKLSIDDLRKDIKDKEELNLRIADLVNEATELGLTEIQGEKQDLTVLSEQDLTDLIVTKRAADAKATEDDDEKEDLVDSEGKAPGPDTKNK